MMHGGVAYKYMFILDTQTHKQSISLDMYISKYHWIKILSLHCQK